MSSLFPDLVPSRPDFDGRDALDRYYTPDAVARALVRHVPPLPLDAWVLEPSVGGGAWVRALRADRPKAVRVHGLDLDPAASGLALCDEATVCDFLDWRGEAGSAIVGNPPYANAEDHVRHALSLAPVVAFLLRLAFLEGQGRRAFWREHPAAKVAVLSARPSFTGGGTDSCAYGFFVWERSHTGPTALVHE